MKYCMDCHYKNYCVLNKSDSNRKYDCKYYSESYKSKFKNFWQKYAKNCIKGLG